MKTFLRLVAIFLAVLALWIAFEWLTFPDVAELAKNPPKTTAFMERRRAELRSEGKDDTLQYRFVSYGSISPNLRRAVLVAEDDSFFEHEGVDLKGMKEALERDWKKKKITHGGSTITQQLAKNLYLSPSRNPVRKIREYFIARALEEHLTKKRILELYLNVVEFGERVYGAEAAARFYFRKSASSLSPSEAALLAGCLPNPRLLNVAHPTKRLRWRQKMILSRMKRWGYIYEKEVLTEKKPEATPTPTDTATTTAPETTTDPDLTPPTETTETTGTAPEAVPSDSGSAPPTESQPAPPPTDSAPPPAPPNT